MSSCVTGAKDSTLPKLSKTERFSKISRNDGRRGTFAEDLARYISRGKRVVQEIYLSDMLGGPGTDVLRRIVFWSIRILVLGK